MRIGHLAAGLVEFDDPCFTEGVRIATSARR